MRSALLSPAALRRELTCSVCLQLFRQPVTLGCGHNFCRACIVQVWESRERQRRLAQGEAPAPARGSGSSYSCPQCRQIFSSKNFTKNFLAANLVERLQESKSASRSPGNSGPKQCKKHQKPMTMYCATDQKILCDICRLSKAHRTCDILLVHELTEEFLKRRKELKAKIEEEFAKLIEFLIEEREIFLVQLEEEEQAALKEMEAGEVDLVATIVELEKSIADIQNKLSQSVSLEEMLDTISQPIPQLEKPANVKLNPRWELFTGPLQFIAWKRMQDVISPGPENLFFDLLTAHPSLRFNSDYTTVESSGSRGQPSDDPERFSSFHGVLATAHFKSGRRYWEVEVGDSLAWYLGVTCVHSARKGYIKLAPSNGYWSICRLLDYWVNEEQRRPLEVTAKLSRVGIYLDFEAGQVSFYDACCMDLLCTFRTTFRCPVAPFFSPSRGVSSILKLCHF
ncbi:E3 ubiquitin-protein ligase TRIM47 [Pristis pectinata]|uniref:E3 ubiquitin-protein ligase TRIM47 n=1 Tax=Pristis pectinata TaxID=685728 RepID=UPI00223D8568|nr:E3 ubiquitin-protein ligase TRIM47 [Pristis pectinata]